MKQHKRKGTTYFLVSLLILFSFPFMAHGENAVMQNEAGIGFENDYEPSTSSTDEPDLPGGTTEPSETVPSTVTPSGGNSGSSGGKKPYYPATGEKQTMTIGIGGLLLFLGVILIIYRRKHQVNK